MPQASTRKLRAGNPHGANPGVSIFLLLQVGFTDCDVTGTARELLPHAFTLTTPSGGRSTLCGTSPRVTPGRRYRPPCPVEPGLSSRALAHRRSSRPLVLSVRQSTLLLALEQVWNLAKWSAPPSLLSFGTKLLPDQTVDLAGHQARDRRLSLRLARRRGGAEASYGRPDPCFADPHRLFSVSAQSCYLTRRWRPAV
jgi:hypothetical protein